jgi:hypothetical protein
MVGFLVIFSGCKPARNEVGLLGEPILSDLKIEILESVDGAASESMDKARTTPLLTGALREGRSLQLKQRLPLIRPRAVKKRLFLVFSEVLGARKITDASYEHRSLTPSNTTIPGPQRALMFYDRDLHRFFLPLDELNKKVVTGLSPLDLQLLEITLALNDGSNTHFEIRFYVNGDFSSAEQVRVSQTVPDLKFQALDRDSKMSIRMLGVSKGWPVLTERYFNPIQRPLTLWFSAKERMFQMRTELGVRLNWGDIVPDARGTVDSGFEPDLQKFSDAPLERVGLTIRNPKFGSASGKEKSIELAPGTAYPVVLSPGQELEVEWRVLASESSVSCQDGAPFSRKFWFCDTSDLRKALQRQPGPECKKFTGMFERLNEPSELSGAWAVKDYEIAGDLKPEVMVTEQVESLERAVEEGQAMELDSTDPKSVRGMNLFPPTSADSTYSCQGIF